MGFYSIAWCQTPGLNSLKQQLEQTSDIENRKIIILKICEKNYSMASDSLLKYIKMGENLIRKISVKDLSYIYSLKAYRVNYLVKAGYFDEAENLADSLLLDKSQLPKNIIQQIEVGKCRALIRNNGSGEAIEIAFKLLQEAEERKDTSMIIQAYVLLGWSNMEIDKNEEAIKWLEKGCTYTSDKKFFLIHPSLFNNIASCYNNIHKDKLALTYIDQGLEYARKAENLTVQANALNIRADIMIRRKSNALAQKDLEEALSVRELLGDPYYILSDMGQLSFFYASEGQFEKGINIAKKGIRIAEEGKQYQKLMYLYQALAENYEKSGNEGQLASTLRNIIALKDSIYLNNSEKAIADLEGKYEYQKHENTIIQQSYELSKGRYILIGSGVLLLLVVLLFFLIYKNYQHVQRRKLEMMMNEQEQLAHAAVLTAEENERKRIAADLHDNLGAHAAAISSSVKYLKEGILNKQELISNLDENASGMVNHLNDTIWVLKNERLQLTNLSDRFKLWIQRLLASYPEIKYHFREDIEQNIEFSPNKILHLFMLLKESVNNAIKHSHCKDISIHIISGDFWEILIEDNGVGFDPDAVYAGYGLQNMQQRAAECGWTILWETKNPGGTRVVLRGHLL